MSRTMTMWMTRLLLLLFVSTMTAGCHQRAVMLSDSLKRTASSVPSEACESRRIDWYDRSDPIERKHDRLGEMEVLKLSFISNCGKNVMQAFAKKSACRAGADAVVMLAHWPPSPNYGTCHQYRLGLIRYTDAPASE